MTGLPLDNLEIVQVYGGFPEDESVNEILEVRAASPFDHGGESRWQYTWVKVETSQCHWPMNDGSVFYFRLAIVQLALDSLSGSDASLETRVLTAAEKKELGKAGTVCACS